MLEQRKENGEGIRVAGLAAAALSSVGWQPRLASALQQMGSAISPTLRILTNTIALEVNIDHSVPQSKRSLVPSPGHVLSGLHE